VLLSAALLLGALSRESAAQDREKPGASDASISPPRLTKSRSGVFTVSVPAGWHIASEEEQREIVADETTWANVDLVLTRRTKDHLEGLCAFYLVTPSPAVDFDKRLETGTMAFTLDRLAKAESAKATALTAKFTEEPGSRTTNDEMGEAVLRAALQFENGFAIDFEFKLLLLKKQILRIESTSFVQEDDSIRREASTIVTSTIVNAAQRRSQLSPVVVGRAAGSTGGSLLHSLIGTGVVVFIVAMLMLNNWLASLMAGSGTKTKRFKEILKTNSLQIPLQPELDLWYDRLKETPMGTWVGDWSSKLIMTDDSVMLVCHTLFRTRAQVDLPSFGLMDITQHTKQSAVFIAVSRAQIPTSADVESGAAPKNLETFIVEPSRKGVKGLLSLFRKDQITDIRQRYLCFDQDRQESTLASSGLSDAFWTKCAAYGAEVRVFASPTTLVIWQATRTVSAGSLPLMATQYQALIALAREAVHGVQGA